MDYKKFIEEKIAVRFLTDKARDKFLDDCTNMGVFWVDGVIPNQRKESIEAPMSFDKGNGSCGLQCGSVKRYVSSGWEVIYISDQCELILHNQCIKTMLLF